MSLRNQHQGRIALFILLYLTEGAPIGFIWWALPTILRTAGVEVPKITALTAMLVLPWLFKFLWAPLVDALRTPRWGFRAWIISAQLAMGATLLPLIWLDPDSARSCPPRMAASRGQPGRAEESSAPATTPLHSSPCAPRLCSVSHC